MKDVDAFVALIDSLGQGPWGELRDFFVAGEPIVVARAPGRLDVMGGIADYSGSLVLQLPIQEATVAAVQASTDGDWQVVSLPEAHGAPLRLKRLRRDTIGELCQSDYGAVRDWFRRDPKTSWAAYVIGIAIVLAKECGARHDLGLRILVKSHVPEAKGVSSSAALEVATIQALREIMNVELDGPEAARLCQFAENHVVGAPCGIMDQMTSALGKTDQLLALLCQPAEVQGYVAFPREAHVWGIDSGIRHAVSGGDYTSVRTGAFMGYRMVADLAGIPVSATEEMGVVRSADDRWRGYLANITPEVFDSEFADRLPPRMKGDEYLERYGGTTDNVTRIDPSQTYSILQPTMHPIYEHARVRRFGRLLNRARENNVLQEMGDLMYASHASYSACGLGSEGTDRLVKLVREAGPQNGLYGAKITGGGSGGTVAILGRADAGDAVLEIAERYRRESGRETYVFSGSSPGAFVE